MPAVPSDVPPPGLSRRTTLLSAGAVALLAAGCTASGQPANQTEDSVASEPGPDVSLAASVLAAETGMLQLVTATRRQHASLRAVLTSVRAVHQEHVARLSAAVPSGTIPSGTIPSGTIPSGTAPSDTARDQAAAAAEVPGRPDLALRTLSRAENRLASDNRRSAFEAESGPFARLLASMAAAAAQQSAVLAETVFDVRRSAVDEPGTSR